MAAPFKVYLKSNVNTYLMLLVWPDQTVRDMADMFVAEHEKHLPQYGLFTAGNISLVMDDGGCVIPESYRLGDVLEDVTANMEVELIKDDTRAMADFDEPAVEAAAETMPNGASNLEVERPNVRRGKRVQASRTPEAVTQKQEPDVPEAADSGLDDDRKETHSTLPSSAGKRKKAVAVLHTDGKGDAVQAEPKKKKRLSTKEDIKARMAAEAMDMLASGDPMSDSGAAGQVVAGRKRRAQSKVADKTDKEDADQEQDSGGETDADEAPKKKRKARTPKEPKSPQSEKAPRLARAGRRFTAAELQARAEKRELTAIEKRVAQAGIEDGSLIPPVKKLGRPSKADQDLRKTYEAKLAQRVAAEVAKRAAARPEPETVEHEDSQLAEGAGSQSGGEVVPPATDEERIPAPTPTQVQHPGSQAAGNDGSSSREDGSSGEEESSSGEESSSDDEGTSSSSQGGGIPRKASSSPPTAKATGQAAIARAAGLDQSPVRTASAAPGPAASMPRIPAPEDVHKAALAKSSVAARPGRPGQAPSDAPGSQQAAASQQDGDVGSSSGTDSSDDSSGSEGSEEDSSSDEDEAAPSSAAKVAAQQPAPEGDGVDSSSSEEGSGDTSDSSGSGKGSSSDDEAAPSSAGTKTADLSAQGRAQQGVQHAGAAPAPAQAAARHQNAAGSACAASSSAEDSRGSSSGSEGSEESSEEGSSRQEKEAPPSSAGKAAAEQPAPGTAQQGGPKHEDGRERAQAAAGEGHAPAKRGGAERSSSGGQASGDSSASDGGTKSTTPAQSTSDPGSDASDEDTTSGSSSGSSDDDDDSSGSGRPAHAGSLQQVPPAPGGDEQPAPAPATQLAAHVRAAGAAPKQEVVPQQQAGPGAGAAPAGAAAAGQGDSSGDSGSEGSSTEGEESEEEESGSDEGQGAAAQPAAAAALPACRPQSAGARQAASSGVAAGAGQVGQPGASQPAGPAEAADSGEVSSSSDEGSGQTAAVGVHPTGHHEITSRGFASKLSPEQEQQLQRFAQQPGGLRSLLQALEQGGGGSSEGTQPVGETPAAPGLLTNTDVTAGGGAEVAGTAEEAEEEPEQHGSSRGASKGGAAKSPSRKKATAAAAGTTGSAAKKGEAQPQPPSSGSILDQIAAQPIASWGPLKDLSKVIRRAVQEWVVEDRAQRGLKADRGSVYQGNTAPAWWPLPVWDYKQLHTKGACVKVYHALKQHMRAHGQHQTSA